MEIKISRGEKLFLNRRRKGYTQPRRKGYTQPQYANLLEMDYYEYRKLEQEGSHNDTVKDIIINGTIGDYCTIMRRRMGLSQEKVAEYLESSRYLIQRMELDEIPNTQLYEHIRTVWECQLREGGGI